MNSIVAPSSTGSSSAVELGAVERSVGGNFEAARNVANVLQSDGLNAERLPALGGERITARSAIAIHAEILLCLALRSSTKNFCCQRFMRFGVGYFTL